MKYTHRLVIGDWSDDGHSKKQFVRFEASHDRKQIVEAYKKAANKADVSVCSFQGGPIDVVCEDYEDSRIRAGAIEKLEAFGISKQDLLDTQFFEEEDPEDEPNELSTWGGEGLSWLFLTMVSKVLPDFEFKLLEDDKHDCINGFWQQDFNGSIGYGVFH
jgi:hypothetical protein